MTVHVYLDRCKDVHHALNELIGCIAHILRHKYLTQSVFISNLTNSYVIVLLSNREFSALKSLPINCKPQS